MLIEASVESQVENTRSGASHGYLLTLQGRFQSFTQSGHCGRSQHAARASSVAEAIARHPQTQIIHELRHFNEFRGY